MQLLLAIRKAKAWDFTKGRMAGYHRQAATLQSKLRHPIPLVEPSYCLSGPPIITTQKLLLTCEARIASCEHHTSSSNRIAHMLWQPLEHKPQHLTQPRLVNTYSAAPSAAVSACNAKLSHRGV